MKSASKAPFRYSYHCNVCGHTVISDTKAGVQQAKKDHRAVLYTPSLDGTPPTRFARCRDMRQIGPNTFCRSSIVKEAIQWNRVRENRSHA